MEITAVSPQQYDKHFNQTLCFNSGAFNALNEAKCESLHCLLFHDDKLRLGLIAGEQAGCLNSPFSAPYGGFSALDSSLQLSFIESAVQALEAYGAGKGFNSVRLMLPPLFYDQAFLTKVTHVLHRFGWGLECVDLNYYYALARAEKEGPLPKMTYSARRNIRLAKENPFRLVKGTNKDSLLQAFALIKANRDAKGYSLPLDENALLATSAVLPIESFLLYLEETPVAAALVYLASPTVPLVVYWGDLPGYTSYKPMNLLTHELYLHYREAGYACLDTGTAMLGELPNYGLAEFKESVGCVLSPRFLFVKSCL